MYQCVWLALAAEKLGMYDDALRFVEYTVEPDLAKGGTLSKWTHTLAYCCKGRVLAKQGKHFWANDALKAGVAASKGSTFPLIEAFALRELAQHDCNEFGTTAAIARQELGAKLDVFDGRLSAKEFAMLRIAPSTYATPAAAA